MASPQPSQPSPAEETAAHPESTAAPFVASNWGEPEAGEVALTDSQGKTHYLLSRPQALRLAARLHAVVRKNRQLDEKLTDFQKGFHEQHDP